VGPKAVVTMAPLLDQDLGLLQGVKDLEVQEFVPELAVEALAVAVLPGTAGLDEQRADFQPGQPSTMAAERSISMASSS
jgi:hypothetical protein